MKSLPFIIFLFASQIYLSSAAYQLVWSEEFDGTSLNTNNWSYDVGDQWYNNELQAYTSKNVYVENGMLRIEGRKESSGSKSYTSGRIKTEGKKAWLFGKFEARMKFPTGKGFWPAFWLWPDTYSTSAYREIDIMIWLRIMEDGNGQQDLVVMQLPILGYLIPIYKLKDLMLLSII